MTDEELEKRIADAFQRDAAELMREIDLPPLGLVVWKARLHARRAEAKRATRVIDRVVVAGPVLTLVTGLSFGFASGSFGRIAAMPGVVPAALIAAALLAAGTYYLSQTESLE
jgi:hypothetical protein